MKHLEQRNPVAERAARRRRKWELERLVKVAQRLEAGELTEEQAEERGLY
jgi:hypothetical protein